MNFDGSDEKLSIPRLRNVLKCSREGYGIGFQMIRNTNRCIFIP